MISAWQIWLIIGIVLLIVELLNAGFGIICFGLGAFLASILAACGLGMYWQLAGFALATFLSFLFIRPIMVKWLDAKKAANTNLDNMIGRQATVVETIESGKGRVAIDGTDWKAVCELDTPILPGTVVTITERQGNTLIVRQ